MVTFTSVTSLDDIVLRGVYPWGRLWGGGARYLGCEKRPAMTQLAMTQLAASKQEVGRPAPILMESPNHPSTWTPTQVGATHVPPLVQLAQGKQGRSSRWRGASVVRSDRCSVGHRPLSPSSGADHSGGRAWPGRVFGPACCCVYGVFGRSTAQLRRCGGTTNPRACERPHQATPPDLLWCV